MSTVRTHARNLAANWVGQASGMIVIMVLSPYLLHHLAKTDELSKIEYGIWSLMNVFTGYLGVFDLGVRASTGRYVILYLGRGDRAGVTDTLKTGLSFFSLLSLAILGLAFVGGWAFPTMFPSVPPEFHATVRILLPLLAVNIWLGALGGAFASVLAAHDRFDLATGVDVTVLALRTAATVAVVMAGYGIVGMTVVIVCGSALGVVGNWALAYRVYPHFEIWPPRIVREKLRELLGFGIATFLGNLVVTLFGQADILIVGVVLGVPAVAVYSVGATIVWYSGPFIDKIAGTIFPTLQRDMAVGDLSAVRWTYLRLVKVIVLIGLPAYIGFAVFGGVFIRLWVGDGFADAFTVMVLLSASRLVTLWSGAAGTLLYATGNAWFLTITSGVEAVLKLAFSLALVLVVPWGLGGVAAGALLSAVAVRLVILPRYAHRRISLTNRTFLVQTVVPGVLGGAAYAGWCLLVRECVAGNTWLLFSGQIVAALAGYAVIAMVLLVPQGDRQRVWRWLRPAAARNAPAAPNETKDSAPDPAPADPSQTRAVAGPGRLDGGRTDGVIP